MYAGIKGYSFIRKRLRIRKLNKACRNANSRAVANAYLTQKIDVQDDNDVFSAMRHNKRMVKMVARNVDAQVFFSAVCDQINLISKEQSELSTNNDSNGHIKDYILARRAKLKSKAKWHFLYPSKRVMLKQKIEQERKTLVLIESTIGRLKSAESIYEVGTNLAECGQLNEAIEFLSRVRPGVSGFSDAMKKCGQYFYAQLNGLTANYYQLRASAGDNQSVEKKSVVAVYDTSYTEEPKPKRNWRKKISSIGFAVGKFFICSGSTRSEEDAPLM